MEASGRWTSPYGSKNGCSRFQNQSSLCRWCFMSSFLGDFELFGVALLSSIALCMLYVGTWSGVFPLLNLCGCTCKYALCVCDNVLHVCASMCNVSICNCKESC